MLITVSNNGIDYGIFENEKGTYIKRKEGKISLYLSSDGSWTSNGSGYCIKEQGDISMLRRLTSYFKDKQERRIVEAILLLLKSQL